MKKRMCWLGLFVVVVCAFIAVPLLQAVEKAASCGSNTVIGKPGMLPAVTIINH